MLALLLALATVGGTVCENDCDDRGCWVLVYRYTVNTAWPGQRPVLETRETFDGRRAPTEEQALCQAEQLRQTGVVLPGLERFGHSSNFMPESITPMPHLLALELGIPSTTPEP